MLHLDVKEATKGKNDVRRFFACILYPKEDPNHERLLQWIMHRWDACYIEHNSHVDLVYNPDTQTTEEKLIKEHVHLLWRVNTPTRPSSMLENFRCWINYIEGVTSVDMYILYMQHCRPKDMTEGKELYSSSDIVVNTTYFKRLIEQNENCAQNDTYLHFVHICECLKTQKEYELDLLSIAEQSGVPFEWVFDNIQRIRYLIQDRREYLRCKREFEKGKN